MRETLWLILITYCNYRMFCFYFFKIGNFSPVLRQDGAIRIEYSKKINIVNSVCLYDFLCCIYSLDTLLDMALGGQKHTLALPFFGT